MGVFSKYNPQGVGRGAVLLQAHPNVHSYPWIPLRTTVRADSQWGGKGKVHRVGLHERGKTFKGTQPGAWKNGTVAAAPSMGSTCGCNRGGLPLGGNVGRKG